MHSTGRREVPGPELVSYHLHAALAYEEAAGRRYSPGFVHASEVTDPRREFCPREWALMDATGGRQKGQSVDAATAYTHELGHMYEELVIRLLGNRVWGDWACLGCGFVSRYTSQPPLCLECESIGFKHLEQRFVSRESGASCGVDMLVRLPTQPKLKVVECKSMMKKDFVDLAMPLAEHRVRTAWYLRIIEESGELAKKLIDTSEARIVYCVKGGWGVKDPSVLKWKVPHNGMWNPFKEFRVKRDDDATQVYHDRARILKQHRDGGPMPAGICPTQFCQRAKSCSMVHPCFSGKYPAVTP